MLQEVVQELPVSDDLFFLGSCKEFLAHQPTTGIQSFATVVRRPRGIDAATQVTALVNQGVESVAPRTTVPTHSVRSAPQLKISQAPLCQVRNYERFHFPAPMSAPAVAQFSDTQNCDFHGIVEKQCHTITVPDRSESPSGTSASHSEPTATQRAKHRGRHKRSAVKVS
jgi:hypothetical protein